MKIAVPFFLITALTTSAAFAQPTLVKQVEHWNVFSYSQGGKNVCYTLAAPTQSEPTDVDHGKNYFIVGRVSREEPKYEPQARFGYQLRPGTKVEVQIGDKTFWLFTKGDRAWMQNETRGPELVDAMRAGAEMLVKATSQRGTDTSYSFPLDGFTAAFKAVTACRLG
ncbi:signal peptide protein (plasmid) [Rhizobium leguminosarum bv. trifolii CB782]|nr:signal peptide protein [Rhizobium leguminosarum bv. trifolii CB782]